MKTPVATNRNFTNTASN